MAEYPEYFWVIEDLFIIIPADPWLLLAETIPRSKTIVYKLERRIIREGT
jgi:hypothetical protein